MRRAVITHAFRTPIGKFLGQFRDLSAVQLGAAVTRGLLERAGFSGGEVEEVVFGCARQAGLGPNPARQTAIQAGIPDSVPAQTVNMACGSGLMALIHAARSVAAGEAECVLAGGMESMSRVPFLLPGARTGYRLGHAPLVDGMYEDGFFCPLAKGLMGETAETLATRYAISREEQDAFAARSQNRAEAAQARLAEEIIPVEVSDRKRKPSRASASDSSRESAVDSLLRSDEHIRPGVTAEALRALPPVFDGAAGTVTAGNSSGITDGAAALLVMSEEAARGRGCEPLAAIEGWQAAGVDPKIMGIGPVPAVRRLAGRLGRRPDSWDLVELNEAFAAQVLACDRELHFDHSRLNVNGGAIALGHPIGATGARIVVTLLHEMRRRGARSGLATLCISGGQGLAASFVSSPSPFKGTAPCATSAPISAP